jgi:hypothetical protein
MKRAGHTTHTRDEKCIKNLVGKPQGNRLLGRPRHTWEDNIKIDPIELGHHMVD